MNIAVIGAGVTGLAAAHARRPANPADWLLVSGTPSGTGPWNDSTITGSSQTTMCWG
jgi:cation diffusion facilitator CzcD-associated flavoprotein CzcO